MTKKRLIIALIFIILVITSLSIGVDKTLTLKTLFAGESKAWNILLASRLPRTITIILSATAITFSGMIMQAIGQNKFISPSTAGTTNAAILGILIGYIIIPGQNNIVKFIFSFSISLLLTGLFVFFINKIKVKNPVYVPLIGMMYGGLISAVTSLIANIFNVEQLISGLEIGSFTKVGTLSTTFMFLVIPALILSVIFSSAFSIMALGRDFSTNLGLNYKAMNVIGLIIVALVSATTFIVVGPLPFLGLVVPNLMSIYYGDNIKKRLLDTMLFSSSFVLLNDIISRLLIFPSEIVISFTMGITGGIIFLVLILRKVKTNE